MEKIIEKIVRKLLAEKLISAIVEAVKSLASDEAFLKSALDAIQNAGIELPTKAEKPEETKTAEDNPEA